MTRQIMTLPKDFEEYTERLMGPKLYATLKQGLAEEAPTSIRLNPFKAAAANIADEMESETVGWCAEGRYLKGRPNFTFDPLFHAGLYYVQEASSMFVAHVLRQLVQQPVAMLDLCAAPGGKSTAARAALPAGSLLFSNEPMKPRASVLAENMIKMGHPDTVVTNNFARDYQRSGLTFDVVMADVPCSGEGMFRKDEGAIEEWSLQNVERCRVLQRSIIEDIWPCLREGGLLIYATCTFNAHENEENVAWIAEHLGADFVEIATQPQWHITGALVGSNPVYRFIPGLSRGEGLFVAVLRKHGEAAGVLTQLAAGDAKAGKRRRRDNGKGKANGNKHTEAEQWIDGSFTTLADNGRAVAIPTPWLPLYTQAKAALHVLHAGVTLGEEKVRDLVPHPSLALSVARNVEAFPQVEVDYKDAIAFLRKEAIVLRADAPRGFVIITYRGHALGFVKNLGNRANNLYPQEWKIKSTHVPSTPPEVLNVSPLTSNHHDD